MASAAGPNNLRVVREICRGIRSHPSTAPVYKYLRAPALLPALGRSAARELLRAVYQWHQVWRQTGQIIDHGPLRRWRLLAGH